ncbi:hypothetical protein EJ05DRAFT_321644 [Pseudovirgaria hyperparasitica]|uniref:Uncharacterized protein n=1 Tax=Pseudovirgaria hyperparasitica TaxID=470096 RepID=A0A6A6VPB4_9PEZI|nr:uncharacterized protein EJ05DRAFT_321644 [Pseudovirgaria hyperparasitica]KAF2752482.1 hypothetical protein EJ05DRAFT_321644 [Pseudovirgaria hyperparasitica]
MTQVSLLQDKESPEPFETYLEKYCEEFRTSLPDRKQPTRQREAIPLLVPERRLDYRLLCRRCGTPITLVELHSSSDLIFLSKKTENGLFQRVYEGPLASKNLKIFNVGEGNLERQYKLVLRNECVYLLHGPTYIGVDIFTACKSRIGQHECEFKLLFALGSNKIESIMDNDGDELEPVEALPQLKVNQRRQIVSPGSDSEDEA